MAQKPEITLTKEQQQLLHEVEQRLVTLAPVLDKLEQCGGDCRGHRTDHGELVRRVAAMRQHFGR